MKHYIDAPFTIKDMTDSGAFVGLGSAYGNVDGGNDIVVPGAFADSLDQMRAKGRMPAMLWQHRQGEPIGAYQAMSEVKDGLECTGRLALKTQRGAEAYELMKMDAVSGLSIGGFTRADSYDHKTDIRTITKFELWEVSVVTFPMNDEARISAVKSIQEIGELSAAELYLREAGGLSRSEAKAIVSRIAAVARREAGAAQDESAELAAITQLLKHRQALCTA